jgi:hypothetical protein
VLDIAYTALLDFLITVKRRTTQFSRLPRNFVPYLGAKSDKRRRAAQMESPLSETTPEPRPDERL